MNARTGRPKTYFASMIHDALYQFLAQGLPYSRGEADRFFLRLMAESEFAPRYIYWFAVRVAGWLVRFTTAKKRQTSGDRRGAADYEEILESPG